MTKKFYFGQNSIPDSYRDFQSDFGMSSGFKPWPEFFSIILSHK